MKKIIYFSTRVTDKVEEIFSAEVCDYVEWPWGLDKVAATIIGSCDDLRSKKIKDH